MQRTAYLTIAGAASAELTEKKSRFIAQAAPIDTEKDSQDFLQSVRNAHPTANHHCYAYRILTVQGITERFSDDGEPAGTAGRPILEVIKNAGLMNLIVVVTRYFGGTLLGTGGLRRAYSKTAALAIDQAGIVLRKPAGKYQINFSYALLGKIEAYCAQSFYPVTHKVFSDSVTFFCIIPDEAKTSAHKALLEIAGGNIRIDNWGEETYIDTPVS